MEKTFSIMEHEHIETLSSKEIGIETKVPRQKVMEEIARIKQKDPIYEFKDAEFQRVLEIWRENKSDPFITLSVAKILSRCRDMSHEEYAQNFLKEGEDSLREIQMETKSALIKYWIKNELDEPLENWSIKQKRAYLKEYWLEVESLPFYFDLIEEKGRDATKEEFLKDENDVSILFWQLRNEFFYFFKREFKREFLDSFHEPDIAKKYTFPSPEIPEGYEEVALPEWQRSIGRISDQFGAVYGKSAEFEFFFALNQNVDMVKSKKKPVAQKISLKEILQKEGFSEDSPGNGFKIEEAEFLYTTLIDPIFRKKIENEFSISLRNFSVRTQLQFLHFLFYKDEEESKDFIDFIKNGKNPEHRLKAFLSLEHGGAEMGKHILNIGKSFPTESSDAIFAKYAEIIETAEKSEQYIRENLSPKAQENISISAISDQLLICGKDMLLGFSRKISTAEKLDAETILSDLERIKGDVILFGNVFRAFAKDNPHATFEDFKELRLETKTGIETARNENDVSQMMEIARNNYTDNAALQTLVLKSLEDGLHKEQSEFFILKRNDRITVFCQYEDRGDFFSAASFNVHPEYRGSALGEVMLHASLDRKAKEKPVYAVTDPEKSVCNSYVERYGFVINDIDHAKVGEQEVLGVNILRDDSVNDSYHYRQDISVSDLAKEMERQRTDSPKNILKKKAPFILSFDRKTKMASFLRIAEKLLREYGYVITRYVPKQKNDDTLLVAFEQKKQPNRLPVPETQKPL